MSKNLEDKQHSSVVLTFATANEAQIARKGLNIGGVRVETAIFSPVQPTTQCANCQTSLVLTYDSDFQQSEESDPEPQQVDDTVQQQGMSLTREHLAAHDLQCQS